MDESQPKHLENRAPPLSKAQEKAKQHWGFVALMGVTGAAFGYFGVSLIDHLFLKPNGIALILLTLLLVPLAWLFAVGWHELGHVLGGWLIGGKFMLWAAGPFMLRATPAGLKWSRNRSVNTWGGMALSTPTEVSKITPRRMAVMILAGPFSSLILFLLITSLVLLLYPIKWATMHNLLAITAILSAFTFIVTILPFVTGGFKSDGKRALDLLRLDAHSEQETALLILTSQGLGGLRPSEYDRHLLERALALKDGSMFDLYAQLTVYYHWADRGEWIKAQDCLDRALSGEEKLAPYLQDLIRYEYAWLLSTQSDHVETAQAWLASANKLDFDPATQLRAEAAVALATEDEELAREKIAEARHALEHRSLSPVKSPFGTSAIDQLERDLNALSQARSVTEPPPEF